MARPETRLDSTSNFDREVPTTSNQERNEKLAAHLAEFRDKGTESFPGTLPDDEIGAWALGQHYDLKTPLLDWTRSPDIAGYFAFVGLDNPNGPDPAHRFVYALNEYRRRDWFQREN